MPRGRQYSEFGTSSLCIGEVPLSSAAQPKTVSANVFADGANQNAGNAMTGRSTTRVSNPPGGTSSIFFDDGAAVATTRKRSENTGERMGVQTSPAAAGIGGGEEPLKLQQRHAELCAQGGRRQSYRHNASSIVIG
mmetsp:Transcript_68838/g.128475  ORF Transcript_68838/g.128475 Transcript_68838/m.128475 type:complete len:136 (+) Transcript_68838:75-482(+)